MSQISDEPINDNHISTLLHNPILFIRHVTSQINSDNYKRVLKVQWFIFSVVHYKTWCTWCTMGSWVNQPYVKSQNSWLINMWQYPWTRVYSTLYSVLCITLPMWPIARLIWSKFRLATHQAAPSPPTAVPHATSPTLHCSCQTISASCCLSLPICLSVCLFPLCHSRLSLHSLLSPRPNRLHRILPAALLLSVDTVESRRSNMRPIHFKGLTASGHWRQKVSASGSQSHY